MIKILVIGIAGRMGKTIAECIEDTEGVRLAGGTEHAGSSIIGQDIGEVAGTGIKGISVVDDPEIALETCDVAIDFTTPDSSILTLKAAAKRGKPLVVGTTGFSTEQKKEITKIGRKNSLVVAPNMSIGVNVLFKLVTEAARVLGDDYDVEIVEAHHKFKKDAPSGTAVRISEIVADTLGRDLEKIGVYGRQGLTERRPKEIGIHTVRAGDIIGEHRVLFGGMGENFEIFHRAQSRQTFARGSIRAAQWILNQPKGVYDMQDVLGLA
ncbi:MAG: 4-hydroxy-tetrahydrodipicolinate reductase [Nitrospinota bacterium]|nr:4-hydroxy-tetrahydrodipicolinate reductase [Nitrospinota bacterium]